VDWCSIRRRPSWSTARTLIADATMGSSSFDFLGYTFRPRLAKWRGGLFGVSYLSGGWPKGTEGDPSDDPGMDVADPE